MDYLSEAFRKLSLLNEDTVSLDDKGIKDANEIIGSDDIEDTDDATVEIIDADASTPEELSDAYVGDAVVQCNVCKSLIYKPLDEIHTDEDGVVNKDEECPYCYSTNGYTVIGKICELDDKDTDKDTKDEKDTEETETEISDDAETPEEDTDEEDTSEESEEEDSEKDTKEDDEEESEETIETDDEESPKKEYKGKSSKKDEGLLEANTKNPLDDIPSDRQNIFEFPSGDYVYVGYDKGILYAGDATNNGIIKRYRIKYDWDESLDANLNNLYDYIIEKNPEFEKPMDESIKKHQNKFSRKSLKEGTSNFWSMKEFPLLVFDDFESVSDYYYDEAREQLGDDADEDDILSKASELMESPKNICVLDESQVDELEFDIDNFNSEMKNSAYDDTDTAEDEYPEEVKVEIKSGYYEAAQLYCDSRYLSDTQISKVNDFFAEMKKKYHLTQLGVAWHASNGETGYNIMKESIMEDTVKTRNGKWTNKGKYGTHGAFKTKKAANAQRRAMFANGFKECTNKKLIKEDVDKIQDYINKYDGLEVSSATLDTADLLTTYYSFIQDNDLSKDMLEEIKTFFDGEPTTGNYFYHECELRPDKEEEAVDFLNNELYDYFNSIAPEGYYFGNTEGDGAEFGFWKDDSMEEKFSTHKYRTNKPIKEDYGWEISSDKAWDAYEDMKEVFGDEELLNSIARALGTVELGDILAFICRNNDYESPYLDKDDDDESEEDDEGESEETITESLKSVKNFDDVAFNRITEKYLTDTYENVKRFRAKNVSADKDNKNLVCEGIVTFNSGKSRPATFKYNVFSESKNKVYLKGRSNLSEDFELLAKANYKNHNLIFENISSRINPKKSK